MQKRTTLFDWISKAKKLASIVGLSAALSTNPSLKAQDLAQIPNTAHSQHLLTLTKKVEEIERRGKIKIVRLPAGTLKGIEFDPTTKTLYTVPLTDTQSLLDNGHEALHVFSWLKHETSQAKNPEMRYVQEMHAYLFGRTGAKSDSGIHKKLSEIEEGRYAFVDFNTFQQLKRALSSVYCAQDRYSPDSHVQASEFVGLHATSFQNFLQKAQQLSVNKKVKPRQIEFFDQNRRTLIKDLLTEERRMQTR